MQLTVGPDDLAAAAAALRRLHDTLAEDSHELAGLGSRLGVGLGVQAAETGRATLVAALHGGEAVQEQLATFARGLTAAAAYYAEADLRALGTVTVR